MPRRLLKRVFHQLAHGKGFRLELAFAREEPHLIIEPHDALDAFAQRRVE